ncbi:Signal transduction histidine kinase CheA [hydrothermal vent metagenome]|uniref:histidine kinase n=1 Tax=hydrothermal vent metagenome TaxID=652676 RepID=A0A3B0X6J8_9ZZZZ
MPNHDNEPSRDGSNEISALSNTAAHLLRCSPTDTKNNTATHLNQYIKQLQTACECLSPSAHESLACFFAIIEEGLGLLIDEKRALTKDESSFLQKIPDILSEYVLIPGSRIPDAKFLKHLKNKYWIRPISIDEEKVLLELLTTSSPVTSAPDETPKTTSETTSEHLSKLIIEPNQALDTAIFEDISIDAEPTLDLDSFSKDIDFEPDTANTSKNKEDIIGSMSPGDGNAHRETTFEKNDTRSDIKPDQQINTLTITEQQQELITLICDELDEVIEDDIHNKIPVDIDITELNAHLINIAELIERISNAIDMIGLEGLGNSCRLISTNVHLLAIEKVNLEDAHKSLIEKWPTLIRLYLKDISNTTHFSDNATFSIIKYLADNLWPDPLTGNEKLKLQSLLTSPQLKEEKSIRQNTARTEDISLELPDDVNNELLDALLLDLPVQTEEFSNALQNMHTKNDIKYLDVAQRVAHTLKGASNVVGVKGIANLTHHLEDILEIQSKAKKLPSTELHNILSDAADCLETMSEALLGIDTPPDNSQEIFQDILDWANKLDTEGATQKQSPNKSRAQTSPLLAFKTDTPDIPSDQAANHISSVHSLAATLRVPVTLADELLRLSGENLISTSQVHEHIKTIKARYNGLKTHNLSLQKLSFNLEHVIDIQGVLNNHQIAVDKKFDPLELDEFHELHEMSRQLIEIAADAFEITQLLEKDIDQLQGLVLSQNKLQKESQSLVLRTRMVPTKSIISRLKRGVKQTCRQTNKWVELEVQHNNTQMDSEVLHQMIEPLMHILRNAIDHGIEPADQRTDQGKNPTGLIKLTFTSEGDRIKIEIKDDGKGLDTKKIKDKAIKLGIINQQDEVDLASLHMLILSSGFTTQSEVSHISGRGIGLDVVNSQIRELKGSLEINSTYRKGCTFTLMLPVSSFSTQSLLIRVRRSTHTFSNRGIEEILYPGHSIIKNLKHKTSFNFKDKTYNICLLEDLLNLPEDRRDIERETRPIILVKDDMGGNMAILVQEVLDSQNVVVKSMGPFIPKIPGIIGATVLGDGSISPVIDIPELLQSASVIPTQFKYPAASTPKLTSAEQQTSYILVVDDSLSARKSLAQFVQDLGFEVRTARDGMEAVSLIEAHKPDLILVDMEMPRMNGLELTSHIRANADTHDMPVIMITSRSTEKHRVTAYNRGVSHYMVKPFEEDELAMHIQGALKSA